MLKHLMTLILELSTLHNRIEAGRHVEGRQPKRSLWGLGLSAYYKVYSMPCRASTINGRTSFI